MDGRWTIRGTPLSFEIEFQEEFKRFESDFQNRALQLNIGYNTREFNSRMNLK